METQGAFMAAAAAAVLLLAVLMRRRDPAAIVYGALTLAFGAWSTGRGGTTLGVHWGPPLAAVGLAFGGPLAVCFAVQLTGATGRLRSSGRALLAGAPLVAALAIALGGGAQHIAQAWGALGVLGATALLVHAARYPHADHDPERTRLGYLATAHGIVAAGLLLDAALAWRGAPRVAFGVSALAYLYLGYLHLGRVRIADLNQLLGNILALAFLAAGLTALFAGLRIWLGPRVDLFVFNAFVASFVLLLFYAPIRDRMQRAIERRFVAGKVALEQALLPLAERLTQILTLDELLRVLLATLERTARVTASSVYLREDPHLGMQQAASIGLSPRAQIGLVRDPTFLTALEAGDVLLDEDLEKEYAEARTEPRRTRLERLLRCLRELDAQVVLPLRASGRLLGFWTLTDARSREAFSRSEVELLRGVAERAAQSIENSKTFERIRARDRLVSLGEMAAGLAHELRNPLATIRGALAMLDEPDPSKIEELHDVIVEEVLRLDRLVATFLDYAQPTPQRGTIGDVAAFVGACAEGVARSRR
jgi:GAF domain-containing protein